MTKNPSLNLLTNTNTSISRRDFLKLKGLMLLWFYFLHTLGINIFADNVTNKIDYSILDKLLRLPFSDIVKKELELRVSLQRKYCYDGNGNLYSLNRFLKEITNYIITNQDFKDFKLLNSINDSQIDYNYMINCTAKHNQVNSLEYIQKRLVSLKDNKLLINALEYAINSQSYETTIYLMKQKLKLDSKTQDKLLNVLQRDEYDIFYKTIINKKNQILLPYKKATILNYRYVPLKDVRNTLDSDIYYKYEDELYAKVYNATAQLYMNYFIDDFTVEYYKEKIDVQVWNHSGIYSINFLKEYEKSLQLNGFNESISDEYSSSLNKNNEKLWIFKQKDNFYKSIDINDFNSFKIELYDLIVVEIL